MKKLIIYTFLAGWSVCALLNAQPAISYHFQDTIAGYEEITGGTVVGADLKEEALQNVAFNGSATGTNQFSSEEGFSIGFDFKYNNKVMRRFAIGAAGYIVLGENAVVVDPTSSVFNSEKEGTAYLAGVSTTASLFGCATTEISYKLIGEAPERTLVVQYKNLGLETAFFGDNTVDSVNLQIRLSEGANEIRFIFDKWVNHNSNKFVRVGLKGASTEDLHLRTGGNNDWTGTAASGEDESLRWNSSIAPADGLAFIFTPPAPCTTPGSQPVNLVLTPTSTGVSGSFTPVENADHYLVVMTSESGSPSLPSDGTTYEPGDALGNGTVITFTREPEFITEDTLIASKKYYFHVYAVNAYCSGGPLYNTVNPLTGNVTLMSGAPEELILKTGGYDRITLSVTQVSDCDVIVAMTTTPFFNKYGEQQAEGVFGTPAGLLNAGDTIEGGGTVIYKGGTNPDLSVEGLEDNSIYYFRAWSIGADQQYSTVWQSVYAHTWGKVPFKACFDIMPAYKAPIGWEVTGSEFRLISQTYEGVKEKWLEGNVQAANMTDGTLNTITTPWILMSEGVNRLLFNYTMASWSRTTNWQPYNNWDEREYIEIQASRNGSDFETVYTINGENALRISALDEFIRLPVLFTGYDGEKIKVRINWKTYNSARLYVRNFVIEEKLECDYPMWIHVADTTITGESALIGWTVQGEETMWEIRYKAADSTAWNEPVEAFVNPYLLTGLPSQTEIEVQVRAKCSLESVSSWSDAVTFKTGYAFPFVESFDGRALPPEWEFKQGDLTDTVTFCVGAFCRTAYIFAHNSVQAMLGTRMPSWLMMPVLDLGDGSVNYRLAFDASLIEPEFSGENPDVLSIVISTDGGKTFTAAGKIEEWSSAAGTLQTIGDNGRIVVDLTGYTGRVRIGFYLNSAGGSGILALDNIGIDYTCPPATNVRVEEIDLDKATLRWEGEAGEWLVYWRKAGETGRDYRTHTGNEFVLADLQPKTVYEAGVTKTCTEGDTAKVIQVRFSTLSPDPCLPVTDIVETPDKTTARIDWTGDAVSYTFRFRKEGTESWVERVTEVNSVSLSGLNVETTYEYAIQSVCSMMPGDTSAWTEIGRFTTLPVTCLVPTGFSTTEIAHTHVVFAWEGDASAYQVACRKGEESWNLTLVENASTATVSELEPLTDYSARIRSICNVGDTSEWSASITFRTAAVPECVIPSNLRASDITDNSVLLEWDADESNLTWDIRYRKGSATSWMNVQNLEEKSYMLSSLESNTIYLWTVKAYCDEGRSSSWATQYTFTTRDGQGIAHITENDFSISVSKRIVSIVNPRHLFVRSLALYDSTGRLIGNYEVRSDGNILIMPETLHTDMMIIRIIGEGFDTTRKVPVR